MRLNEKTRRELINQSKNADIVKTYGTTRYERRNVQHVYNPKESLNKLDMNALWKANILSFYLPVQGETNNYSVEILFDGVLDDINSELKRNGYIFEYKVVYRAIINAINRNDIYVSCTCPDWYYRMSYQATKGRYNSGKSQIIPAKITNPNNTKGAGCKHVMKVLGSLDWALDLASCITNYVEYMKDNYRDKYEDIIFPAIYGGMSYIKAINDGIIEPEEGELNIEDEIEDTVDDEISDEIEDEEDDEDIVNDNEEEPE